MKIIFLCTFLALLMPAFSQEQDLPNRSDYIPVLSGFDNGRVASGDWQSGNGILMQNDPAAYHAKYLIPLVQKRTNYLYTLKAIGQGGGRIGYGLHFFAGNYGMGDLYGFGTSLLVWVTRDSDHYGNAGAYVQLYRSFTVGRMIEIGSVLIAEPFDADLKIEVYVNVDLDIVSVSVNGDLKLFVPVKDFDFEGTSIALRALGGPVRFISLEVLEKK